MTKLKDEFGRPGEPKKAQASGQRLIKPNYQARTWSSTITRGISIDQIVSVMQRSDQGNPADAITIFRRMVDTDATLWSAINSRKLPILGAGFKIMAPDPLNPVGVQSAKMVTEQLGRVMDLETSFSALLEAWADGVAVAEIMWDGTNLADLIPVPGEFQSWDLGESKLQLVIPDQKSPGFTFRDGVIRPKGTVIDMVANKFIAHSPRMKSGPPHMRGAWRTLAAYWIIKHYALQDWAAFTEVYGMPIRIGRFPSSATPSEVALLEAAIQALGSDAAAVMPEGMMIEIQQPGAQIGGSSGPIAFQKIIDYCDKEMTKLILGQTLTSDLTGNTGTFAAAKIHNEVRKDILLSDARALARTLRRDLFRPLVQFNAPGAPVPVMVWNDLEDEADAFVRAQTIEVLVRHCGLKVSASQIYEEFDLKKPESEEDTLLGRDFDAFNEEGDAKVKVAEITAGAVVDSAEIKTSAKPAEKPAEKPAAKEALSTKRDPAAGIIGSAERANASIEADLNEESAGGFRSIWQAIQRLSTTGLNPDQVVARLSMLYPDIDTSDLEDVLARAMLATFANGITAVELEAKRALDAE